MKTTLLLLLISQNPTIRIEGLDIITDSSSQTQAQIQALQAQVSQMQAELDGRGSGRQVLTDPADLATLPCRDTEAGCAVKLAPGTYEIAEPIRVCNTDVDAYGVLIVAQDTTGVILEREGGCGPSTWRGGRLRGAVTSTAVRPLPVGFDVRSPSTILDAKAGQFVRGLQMVCADRGDVDRQTALGFDVKEISHCNHAHVARSTFSSNLLDGVFVRGADANAGTFVGVNSFLNCQQAADIVGVPADPSDPYSTPTGASCANFHESSFLGNTYVGPHSAHSVDQRSEASWTLVRDTGSATVAETRDYRWWQILAHSSNGRNVFLGAYTESDVVDDNTGRSYGNGPSVVSGYGHHVYGGLNQIRVEGGAWRISERGDQSHLRTSYMSEDRPGLGYRIQMGTADVLPVRLKLYYPDSPDRTLSLQHFPSGWLELEAGRATADRALSIWLGDQAEHMLGTLKFFKPWIFDQDATEPVYPEELTE